MTTRSRQVQTIIETGAPAFEPARHPPPDVDLLSCRSAYLGVPVPFSLLAGRVSWAHLLADVLAGCDYPEDLRRGRFPRRCWRFPFFLLVGELMSSANVVVAYRQPLGWSLVRPISGGGPVAGRGGVLDVSSRRCRDRPLADVAVMSRALGGPDAARGLRNPRFYRRDHRRPPPPSAALGGRRASPPVGLWRRRQTSRSLGLFMAGRTCRAFMIGFGLMIYCYFLRPPLA